MVRVLRGQLLAIANRLPLDARREAQELASDMARRGGADLLQKIPSFMERLSGDIAQAVLCVLQDRCDSSACIFHDDDPRRGLASAGAIRIAVLEVLAGRNPEVAAEQLMKMTRNAETIVRVAEQVLKEWMDPSDGWADRIQAPMRALRVAFAQKKGQT